MRVVICGSRNFNSWPILWRAVEESGFRPSLVLSGAARGADYLGEFWAALHGVPVERHPAEWDRYGKPAGYVRNCRMAERCDAVLAIWNGRSPGTRMMIDLTKKLDIPTYVWRTDLPYA